MKREELLKKITFEAGKETLKLFGKTGVKYTKKNSEDVVTEADLKSEKILVDAIKKYFPNDGIISEESEDYNVDSEYVWIMDPLDGTWNFSKGIPIYGVLVAIAKKKEVIAGAAYFPKIDEFYFAQKGKGATLNGKKIICSDKKDMYNVRVTGSIIPRIKFEKQLLRLIKSKKEYKYWHTEYGCGAYDMCLVASGRSHMFINPGTSGNIWDIASPYIILKESKCKITNFNGNNWTLKDKTEIITASPILHKRLMKILDDA